MNKFLPQVHKRHCFQLVECVLCGYIYAFWSYQCTCHSSNSSCLFLKLKFQALLEWIIISNDLFKHKDSIQTFFLCSSICYNSGGFSPPQVETKCMHCFYVPCSAHWSDIHSYTQVHLLVFLNILYKIWTVYHWHVYIMLCQNMKHILPETELVWQKGQVFGSHTHQFSVYSNPSTCWGPIIIIVLALFSVVILRM